MMAWAITVQNLSVLHPLPLSLGRNGFLFRALPVVQDLHGKIGVGVDTNISCYVHCPSCCSTEDTKVSYQLARGLPLNPSWFEITLYITGMLSALLRVEYILSNGIEATLHAPAKHEVPSHLKNDTLFGHVKSVENQQFWVLKHCI